LVASIVLQADAIILFSSGHFPPNAYAALIYRSSLLLSDNVTDSSRFCRKQIWHKCTFIDISQVI